MQAAYPPISLGETAERVADEWSVARDRQDAFALESQRRAVTAIEAGRFDGQLVPVSVAGRKGAVTLVERDEHPRPDTTAQALGGLRPAFKAGGSVTAGNSSGINDGPPRCSWRAGSRGLGCADGAVSRRRSRASIPT